MKACYRIGKLHFVADTYPGGWILGIRIQSSFKAEYTIPAYAAINVLWLSLSIHTGCGGALHWSEEYRDYVCICQR